MLFVLSSFIQGEIILNKLCFAPDGVLWLGLSTGLFKMEQTGDIHLVLEDSYVNDILSIADSLYVGTSDGMIVYNKRASTLVKKVSEGTDVQTLYYDRVLRQLWMGTFNSGLLRMDLHTGCLSKMYTSYSALMNPIRAISEYDSDNLLIGIDSVVYHR